MNHQKTEGRRSIEEPYKIKTKCLVFKTCVCLRIGNSGLPAFLSFFINLHAAFVLAWIRSEAREGTIEKSAMKEKEKSSVGGAKMIRPLDRRNLHMDMRDANIIDLMIGLSLIEHSNHLNIHMDMSVDDITNLMNGLRLVEYSDNKILHMDISIGDITDLMKILSLTSTRESLE
ncbi:hypothetical protein M5K25_000705 [Dendrobium thyrsiflorum]|uniref:Uncharacterized protein n=1 Tax=Dendrobium thyrsiflorum TaxID=117978 RepID=A0ABD0WCT7_DENTH